MIGGGGVTLNTLKRAGPPPPPQVNKQIPADARIRRVTSRDPSIPSGTPLPRLVKHCPGVKVPRVTSRDPSRVPIIPPPPSLVWW